MKETLMEILSAGVQAPSGGNSQPWQFEVHNNKITIIALPEKDHPILNYKNRGTWIAHGALIENILIEARNRGFKAHLEYFPDAQKPNITAHIELSPDVHITPDAIPRGTIFDRSTNRKPYKKKPLPESIHNTLLRSIENISGCSFSLLSSRSEIDAIAKYLSVTERVMFENKKLHRLFFKEVVWNKEEEKKKGGGLNVQTLELAKPQLLMMRLLMQFWGPMFVLGKLGMAKAIAKDNAKRYASSGALGALIVNSEEDHVFLNTGRALERIWLTATAHNLQVQPISGFLFFWQALQDKHSNIFSQDEQKLIETAYAASAKAFNTKDGFLVFIFRIGEAEKPSTQSSKLPPVVSFF